MSKEASFLMHELAAEFRKLVEEEKRSKEGAKQVSEVSEEDRELVRSELASLAEFLHKNYGLSVRKIRRFLREMLTVSV